MKNDRRISWARRRVGRCSRCLAPLVALLAVVLSPGAADAAQRRVQAPDSGRVDVALQTTVPAGGTSLDKDAIDDIGRRLREASLKQTQTVARSSMAQTAECQERVAGMVRDPYACLEARSRRNAAALSSERETLLSLLAQAEASFDSDLASLPAGQIQRFRAMETLNEKYASIVTFTRGTARGQGAHDAPVKAACERFERKRLAASGGQDATPTGNRKARRAPGAPER